MLNRSVYLATILLFTLTACGEHDEAHKKTQHTKSAAHPAASTQPIKTEKIEKAEGVVYEDEIYENWPYQ